MRNLLLRSFLVGTALIGSISPLLAQDHAMTQWIDPENHVTLVQPEGWRREDSGPLVALTSPEGDISLWFGLSESSDPADVVDAAWAEVGEAVSTPQAVVPAPPRDGFDTATAFVYPPEGDLVRQAVVERRAGRLHVTLIRGTMAALDRRGAQVNIAVTGFQPMDAETMSLSGVSPAVLDAADLMMLGTYVEDNLAHFEVPGAVVAVVQDGEVRMLRGFGVRTRGTDQPVTPDTRMMIAPLARR